MRINRDTVAYYLSVLERKRQLWASLFPNLEFDRFGRAKIKEQNERTYEVEKYYKENVREKGVPLSASFIEAFNAYLQEAEVSFINGDNILSSITSGKDIPIEGLRVNRFKLYDGRKPIEIKASKVLAKVQEIWSAKNPKYEEVLQKIREVPVSERNGGAYLSLMLSKTLFEKGNLYVDYQKIMNSQAHRELFITINPLDFLTSSGGDPDDHGINPTKFHTCLSLSMRQEGDAIVFDRVGCYSSPKAHLLLASIPNVALIYQKNGNFVSVPNSDFAFMGYSVRGRCWLDRRGLWIENFYPYRIETEKLIRLGLPLIQNVPFSNKHDFSHFLDIEDRESVKNFADYCYDHIECMYLDRVGVTGDGRVYMLPDFRKEYDESGGGVKNPYDEGYEYEFPPSEIEIAKTTPSTPSVSVSLSQRLEEILRRNAARATANPTT